MKLGLVFFVTPNFTILNFKTRPMVAANDRLSCQAAAPDSVKMSQTSSIDVSTSAKMDHSQTFHDSKDKLEAEVKSHVVRMSNFSPSIWGDCFSSPSPSIEQEELEMHAKEIEELRTEVRHMLMTTDMKAAEKINLIDTLERLGLSYHFDKEIEQQLEQIYYANDRFIFEENDLYNVTLQFRVFRQHGYHMPCGVFNKFKDKNFRFKETLITDVKGMLSLYEAAQVRIHGEDILDEALTFTATHLKSMAPRLSSILAEEVKHALDQPLHEGMERIEARYYINLLERSEHRNEKLLRFAKVDFNLLQMLHRQELHHLTRWWKELDLVGKLGYAKDRLVECYFWIFAMHFEPQYSLSRIWVTKFVAILSIIDDTYDSYGTLEELKLFTEAVQRWDISIGDRIPDYMKSIYEALLNLFQEIEEEMRIQGRSYSVHYTKESLKELVMSYHIEAKWFFEGHIPSFERYMSNALITCTHAVMATSSFMCMGEIADTAAFRWLQNRPKVLTASEIFCRHMDDIRTFEGEKKRGQLITGLERYMYENGVSKKEVTEEFYRRMKNAWKDINEEILTVKPTSISMHLIIRIVNLVRVMGVAYKYTDGYGHPERALKDHIISMFVDPIPL